MYVYITLNSPILPSMIKPKFEQPKLITHGTVESMTLQTGPHDDLDYFFFGGSHTASGEPGDGSQHLLCDDETLARCRKRG